MKKIYLLLMMAATLFTWGCGGGDDGPGEKLEVSPEELILSENGEGMLIITSNVKWEISTTASWMTFSTTNGEGNEQVTVRADDSSKSERAALVTIKGGSLNRQVVVTQLAPKVRKHYIYGDVVNHPEQTPFQPGAWDAAAMRFSDTEGEHFPTIPDEVYFGLKTLIFDVSDAKDCDLRVMNAWWSRIYYDHVQFVSGLNEIKITPTMAKECAKGNGGEGKDLDLMLYSGTCTINAVYYEE